MWSTSVGGHLMKVVTLTGFTVYKNDRTLNVEDGQLVLFVADINLLIIEKDENVLQYEGC